MVNFMVKELSLILMENGMKENGSIGKNMVKELSLLSMETSM